MSINCNTIRERNIFLEGTIKRGSWLMVNNITGKSREGKSNTKTQKAVCDRTLLSADSSTLEIPTHLNFWSACQQSQHSAVVSSHYSTISIQQTAALLTLLTVTVTWPPSVTLLTAVLLQWQWVLTAAVTNWQMRHTSSSSCCSRGKCTTLELVNYTSFLDFTDSSDCYHRVVTPWTFSLLLLAVNGVRFFKLMDRWQQVTT